MRERRESAIEGGRDKFRTGKRDKRISSLVSQTDQPTDRHIIFWLLTSTDRTVFHPVFLFTPTTTVGCLDTSSTLKDGSIVASSVITLSFTFNC